MKKSLLLAGLLFLGFSSPLQAQNTQELKNLRAFSKLYSYMRYFYPGDRAASINWESFAVYGAHEVRSAQNLNELEHKLEQLFLPLAPALQIYQQGQQPQALKLPQNTQALKLVAWQHFGVGSKNPDSIYRSLRLNRKLELVNENAFGALSQKVPLENLRGKEVRFRAWVKTEGKAYLWLRVDRPDKQKGFFDNMGNRPIQSRQWQAYEIQGTVDSDASTLILGLITQGKGKTWMDGAELQVKEGNQWQPVALQNPDFESVSSNQQPEGWASSEDYTFQTVSPGYQSKQALVAEAIYQTLEGPLFEAEPLASEVIDKDLIQGLHARFPLALYSDDKQTLDLKEPLSSEASQARFEQLQQKLAELETQELNLTNPDVRLADVIISWNVFQHFYPYFDVSQSDWSAQLDSSLAASLKAASPKEFVRVLKKMVAALKDGHGNVYNMQLEPDPSLPLLVDWVENQLVVTKALDPAFERGDIIQSINGVPAAQVLTEQAELFSGSLQWRRYRALNEVLRGQADQKAELELLRKGQKLKVQSQFSWDPYAQPASEFERPKLEKLPGEIYYLNLDQLEMAEIEPMMAELAQAKGLIFDLRGYPHGTHSLISHLIDQPVQSAKWMIPLRLYPDQEKTVGYHTEGRWTLEPEAPRFQGKVVFITNALAISYAESFMGIIEHYKLAEIVGEPTAGANGNINPFSLPGDLMVYWTGMKVIKHDDSQHHLIGIQPTLSTHRSLAGVKAGRDELFEKALETVKR